MLELREKHPEVSAIVCNGDVVALGACHALRRIGEMPGQEVSVVGFDDIQDASVATPPSTTMAVSPYQLGKILAQKLIGRLNDPETGLGPIWGRIGIPENYLYWRSDGRNSERLAPFSTGLMTSEPLCRSATDAAMASPKPLPSDGSTCENRPNATVL